MLVVKLCRCTVARLARLTAISGINRLNNVRAAYCWRPVRDPRASIIELLLPNFDLRTLQTSISRTFL